MGYLPVMHEHKDAHDARPPVERHRLSKHRDVMSSTEQHQGNEPPPTSSLPDDSILLDTEEFISGDSNLSFGDSTFSDGSIPPISFCFPRRQSSSYFENHHKWLGPSYLVAKSHFHSDILGPKLLPEDIDLNIHLAHLVSGLTHGQHYSLAEVLKRVVASSSSSSVPCQWHTRVPTTKEQLR